MTHIVGNLLGHNRMRFQQFMARCAQTVVAQITNQHFQDKAVDNPAQPQRQPQLKWNFVDRIPRFAKNVLRRILVAALGAVERHSSILGSFGGDVTTGIARADHQHAPVPQHIRRFRHVFTLSRALY